MASINRRLLNVETKIKNQESAKWATVQPFTHIGGDALNFLFSVKWLRVPVEGEWYDTDKDALEIRRQMGRIRKSLPPVASGFLPGLEKNPREVQWAMHNSAEYYELISEYWKRADRYFRAKYGSLTCSRLEVSFQLFEDDLNQWEAEYIYIGIDGFDRKEVAADQIDFCRRLEAAGWPHGAAFRDEWDQILIDYYRDYFGRETTKQDIREGAQIWRNLRQDMKAGKPASESEAAQYLRDNLPREREQWPRIKAVIV